ncbi:hypothetical protein [Streptomyces sp. SP2-10]|uniref:hypothetical protein n=1 Tax=Streptomyces sp. SP2-10 TaxID=2873385 RepID=UPI001CA6E9EE|nr:hypothetical protein [Streptomyces sp. SP2-10]MBY8840885.1 hypothetical protein [Streptomyces sp. SP2-10]
MSPVHRTPQRTAPGDRALDPPAFTPARASPAPVHHRLARQLEEAAGPRGPHQGATRCALDFRLLVRT